MRWVKFSDKSTLRRVLRSIQAVKTWQLIVVLLLGIIASATLLRLNNIGMDQRRVAVIRADEKGDIAALKTSIVKLQSYVTGHMNTNMDKGFFLSKSYERDRDAALAQAGSASNPNSAVYQQASVECRAKWRGGVASFRNDYVQCVIDRVSALSPGDDAASVQLPRADAYKINFSSPVWSADLAGASVAFCLLIFLLIAGRVISVIVLRALLRRHYQSA